LGLNIQTVDGLYEQSLRQQKHRCYSEFQVRIKDIEGEIVCLMVMDRPVSAVSVGSTTRIRLSTRAKIVLRLQIIAVASMKMGYSAV
jgi:hypothetical protein